MWTNKIIGGRNPILVLCDAPSFDAERSGRPLTEDQMRFFASQAMKYGFEENDFVFVSPCPPIDPEIVKSASKKWKHVEQYVEMTNALIEQFEPRIIVPMGELASRVVLGRAVKITKARGVPQLHNGTSVLPMLSPGYVQRSPDALPAMLADLNTLKRIKDADYQISDVETVETHYQWIFDLDTVRDQIRQVIAVDTETTGLRWHENGVRVLTVQITPRAGVSFVCPVDAEYCAKWFPDFPEAARLRLLAQIKVILEDPSIMKLGFNFKFDHLMLRKLGIEVVNWVHDGQLMMFCVDENMMRKNLDEGVRIFVPEMAGYADEFNKFIDKSRMLDVPPEDILNEEGDIDQFGMLNYAGGDTDATYRLIRVLQERMKQDKRTQNCYRKIMMPAMLVFANSVERWGIAIDRDALAELEVDLKAYTSQKYRQLVRMAPAAVREAHLDAGKELKFSRPDFTRDILFSQNGFKLKPVLFTDSTKDLKDESKKVPSTSKDHLTYFVSHPNKTIAEFCTGLIQLSAAEKMLSTYVGSEEDGSGFHKYMSQIAAPVGNHRGDGTIYPSYMLHRTNTGRTASSDPNGQNFPKRSPKGGPDWAKQYQGIFKSRPGWKLVNCDLSQIELRLVAWMASEPTMLDVYANNGDIHTTTARDVVMGISEAQWLAQSPDDIKLNRFKAKAVNFGLVYGMAAPGFQVYAKTDYGIDLTLKEAEAIRNRYFQRYSGLLGWHGAMKGFAHRNGYVRALHGAIRHLPSIFSNDRAIVSQAERQAVNAPIQRFGSDLGLMAMTRFASQADPNHFRLIGFVHDALIMECREGMEEEGAAYLKWAMQTPPLQRWFGIESPIPILAECDIATGDTSASLVERPDIEAIKPDWWLDDEDEQIHLFVSRGIA